MTSQHLIFAVTGVLLVLGLIMVLSASSIISVRRGDGAFSVFISQAIFAAIGAVAFVVAMRLPLRVLRTAAFPGVLISILLLGLVLVIGRNLNGATSWFAVGPISVQPSELAKLSLLVWMGHVLASRRHTLRSLRQLLFPVFPIFGLMVFLIMQQPDLGTTISLALVFFAVLFFAGAPWWIFGSLAVLAAGGIYYLSTSASYRAMRIMAFLYPNDPAYEKWTYQLNQGLYGMGNGGLFGTGIGQSQSKWSALPHAESDFIFAIIGEELGLFGTMLVLVLYALLAYTGLRIVRRNVDPFVRIVAGGATVWLVGQACINIGYVVGLLPVTGLTLPMISAGGTSLMVTMFVLGLLANFARQEPPAAATLYAQGPGRLGRFLGLGRAEPGADTESPARKAKRAKRAARLAVRLERQRLHKQARAERYRESHQRPDVRGSQGDPARRPTRPSQRPGLDPQRRAQRPSGDARRTTTSDRRTADGRRRRDDPAAAGNGRRTVNSSRRETGSNSAPRRTGERTVRR